MRLAVGILVILASVLGGYMAMGGHLEVLVQPFEALIILGAAFGAFVIGNTGPVLKQSLGVFGTLVRGPRYNKDTYVELLGLQYSLFKLVQARGLLALEPHIEDPDNSPIFQRFPKFAANHHAVEFMCDYLRMVTLGTNNVHELEALMDEELDTGDILVQHSLPIGPTATGTELVLAGMELIPGAIQEALAALESGNAVWRPQQKDERTYFHKRSDRDSRIDWQWDAVDLERFVRALSAPYPRAFSFYRGERIDILAAEVSSAAYGGTVGRVIVHGPV